jgi:putative addiction module component (TIGR02574 family)
MTLDQIEHEALSLPLDERALLAQRLLLSLEEISESEFDNVWGGESAARAAQFDAGQTQAISGEEVARKARALLR